jgi:intracellular multiplication protein IcmS
MDINEKLVKIAKIMKTSFTLNDRLISPEEIFSNTGLLPAMARRADQLSSLCLGYGIGINFEEAEGALLGVKVIFDEITPDVLRLLTITDVLCELVNSAPLKTSVSLDELMYD